MSHVVSVMVEKDNLYLPTASRIALALIMFALSQLQMMANPGRGVSATSLVALLAVATQCLHVLCMGASIPRKDIQEHVSHAHRRCPSASRSDTISFSSTCGMPWRINWGRCRTTYVAAGPQPPSFLLDAMPPGLRWRVRGLLLWVRINVR